MKYDVSFNNYEKVNSQFAKVKVYVLYTGLNRNNSYISKQTVENALYSLKNVPVVGEWIEENKNFGGHGGKIEIKDEEMKFIDTTKPYGVVPSDAEFKWEVVREKDGITENEYLTTTAYLWYGRYPEVDKVLNEGNWQSMEIDIGDYEWNESGQFEIKSFEFSALCILGKDDDIDKNVEPCFESSSIVRYSFNKDEFKLEFNKMIDEIKNINQEDYNLTKESDGDNVAKKEKSEKIITEEIVKDENFETKDEVIKDETVENFEETKKDELKDETVETKVGDDNEKTEKSEEVKEEKAESKDEENEEIELSNDKSEDELESDFDYKGAYETLQKDFEEFKNNHSALESELKELREFKNSKLAEERKVKEDELFDEYKELSSLDDYNSLKEKSSEFSLEDLEKELALLYVKSNKKSKEFSKKAESSIKIPINKTEQVIVKYGGLFEKYGLIK